ncbi:MAG: peptide chain release factor N(5)-glutamine methyltransferase [Calditrichaeota bacterium]|nr:peptide chain release factor N(5)-glutamine methyltransferase [Calditrichota bacterium]
MQSIAELLDKTHKFFLNKQIDDARYHAERLLAECLNSDRMTVYLNLEKIADEDLISSYRNRIQSFLNSPKNDQMLFDVLTGLKKKFKESQVPEADLHAEEIVAHILNMNRNELKLIDDRPLAIDELDFIKRLSERRLKREPLQYILGYTEFYGYPIRLNKNVLIPRPETELLVEQTLERIKNRSDLNVLDIGTGSGCIAIALKKQRPDLNITAIDFSEQAILQAEKNAGKNAVEIRFIQFDFLDRRNWPSLGNFDLFISNPPYVNQSDLQTLEAELSFEPQSALSDFSDGFTFYRAIADFAGNHLNENGLIAMEIGYNQSDELCRIFSAWQSEVLKDYNSIDRIVICK